MSQNSSDRPHKNGVTLIAISEWVDAHLYFVRTAISLTAISGIALIGYSTGLHKCYRSSTEIARSEFLRRSKLRVRIRQIALEQIDGDNSVCLFKHTLVFK